MTTENLINSSTKQAFIDTVAAGLDLSKVNSIDDIPDSLFLKADVTFKRHKIPERHLYYSRFYNFSTNKALYALKPEEMAVFVLMANTMSQENEICLSAETISKALHIYDKKVRTILQALQQYGFIKLCKRHNSYHPNIYKINPDLVQSGSDISTWDFFESVEVENFYNLLKNNTCEFFDLTLGTKDDQFNNYNTLSFKLN